MGLTIRHCIFRTARRVSRRIVDALPFRTDTIPAYAGTTQRNAQVLIDNEDGKPVLDAIGSYWVFDAHGKIDESLRRSGAEWLSFAFSTAAHNKIDGPVVDLVPELKRKDLHKRHRWMITKGELT